MAVDEHNRDVLEAMSGEQRRPRAMLPGLPRIHITSEAFESAGALPGVLQDRASDTGEHFGDALHLVRAASDALERMRARCREIETYCAQQADYYRAELSMAHSGIRDLQEQTLARDEMIQRLEAQVRAEAEQRRSLEEALKSISESAQSMREQIQHTEARAVSAEAWLSRFQGEIATAFGEIPRILGEIDQETEAAAQSEERRVNSRHG